MTLGILTELFFNFQQTTTTTITSMYPHHLHCQSFTTASCVCVSSSPVILNKAHCHPLFYKFVGFIFLSRSFTSYFCNIYSILYISISSFFRLFLIQHFAHFYLFTYARINDVFLIYEISLYERISVHVLIFDLKNFFPL